MLQSVKNVVLRAPRASFSKPHVSEDLETGNIIVKAGSPADACRFIEALRGAGYAANSSPWDWRQIVVRPW